MFLSLLFTSAWANLITDGPLYAPEGLNHADSLTFSLKRELSNSGGLEKRLMLLFNPVLQSSKHYATHNKVIDYSIQLALGTPLQSIDTLIDIKRPGTYILLPSGHKYPTNDSKTYHPGYSETFSTDAKTFRLNGKGSHNKLAFWGEDTLTINSQKIKSFKFMGFGAEPESRSRVGLGLMSRGFVSNESRTETSTNFPMQLKEKGLIASACYSIWIGENNNDGMIRFGYFDAEYPKSSLHLFPLIKLEGKAGFFLSLNNINLITNENITYNLASSLLAEIDFTSELSVLPRGIFNRVNTYLQTEYETYSFSCSKIHSVSGISLDFAGVSFVLPFHDISPQTKNRAHACVPPFLLGRRVLLGANILKSFYAVFDLEKEEVGLALMENFQKRKEWLRDLLALSTGILGTTVPSNSLSEVTFKPEQTNVTESKPFADNFSAHSTMAVIHVAGILNKFEELPVSVSTL